MTVANDSEPMDFQNSFKKKRPLYVLQLEDDELVQKDPKKRKLNPPEFKVPDGNQNWVLAFRRKVANKRRLLGMIRYRLGAEHDMEHFVDFNWWLAFGRGRKQVDSIDDEEE
jgi:hypothetical protein